MSETIGQQLKQRREAKALTIQKVAQATHIRAQHIEAIEADNFDALPSPVQARAFLRLYAEFLGISLDEVIARQRSGMDESPAPSLDLPPAQVEQADAAAGPEAEPAETQKFNKKTDSLLARLKRGFSGRAVQPALIEPIQMEDGQPETLVEEVPTSPGETLQSRAIFASIGATLRQRRESLGLALEEVEHHTHVRKHYLMALEAGEFERLPSSVQARGMLNNYARFLDLDLDTLLLSFAEGLQVQRVERQPKVTGTPQKPDSKTLAKIKLPASLRRYLSVDVFVGGGLVLLLVTFAIWGTSRVIGQRAGTTPQPTAPSIANILESTSTADVATATPTPILAGNETSTALPVAGETLVQTLPAAGHGPVQVVVVAQEQAWVRVTVDGKVVFEGRTTAGTAYPYDGITQIEVLTGNGRAISILYNQNDLGPMGTASIPSTPS
jgi:cytoskeleton protein RodZ